MILAGDLFCSGCLASAHRIILAKTAMPINHGWRFDPKYFLAILMRISAQHLQTSFAVKCRRRISDIPKDEVRPIFFRPAPLTLYRRCVSRLAGMRQNMQPYRVCSVSRNSVDVTSGLNLGSEVHSGPPPRLMVDHFYVRKC
jgi:hypothetical protein